MSQTLDDWLERISHQHPQEIELGLARCRTVLERLIPEPLSVPIITVAGTNGKGSTVAYLDALARATGKKPLTFTSPHLFDYRERLTFDGSKLTEAEHIEAFAHIEGSAAEIPLTFFEFSALSAFYWCNKLKPDLLILEVGLGGRLDATNIVAPDIAVITTIDFDHQDYLGNTLEAIATEKLGVVHPGTMAVLADRTIPASCLMHLNPQQILRFGVDYEINQGVWHNAFDISYNLPQQIQPETNSAAALTAYLNLFPDELTAERVDNANNNLQLAGRYQIIATSPTIILDVAHNPQAISHLTSRLKQNGHQDIHCVFGMMKDKNMSEVVQLLSTIVKHWHFCDIDSARAASASQLSQLAYESGISLDKITCYSSPLEAYQNAKFSLHDKTDTLLVVGSFLTVGPVLEQVKN